MGVRKLVLHTLCDELLDINSFNRVINEPIMRQAEELLADLEFAMDWIEFREQCKVHNYANDPPAIQEALEQHRCSPAMLESIKAKGLVESIRSIPWGEGLDRRRDIVVALSDPDIFEKLHSDIFSQADLPPVWQEALQRAKEDPPKKGRGR